MKNKKIYLILKLVFFLSINLFTGCRKKKLESLPPYTKLEIKVKDSNGSLLNGVNVAVFSSFDDFNESILSNYDFSKALAVGVSIDGKVILDSIPSRLEYWILAYQPNTTLFPGFTIYYDNSEQTNKIPFRPNDKSEISLSIILKPAEGLVTFWTKSKNAGTNPIRVVSGENTPLNTVIVSIPNQNPPLPNPAHSLKKRKGSYNYYGIASSYCAWTGNYTIIPGAVVPVELLPCTAGSVTFYSSQIDKEFFPIEIMLVQGSKKDTLFSPAVGSCGQSSNNVKTYNLPPGEYSYFAKSLRHPFAGPRTCVWSDRFVITENSCVEINLPACK